MKEKGGAPFPRELFELASDVIEEIITTPGNDISGPPIPPALRRTVTLYIARTPRVKCFIPSTWPTVVGLVTASTCPPDMPTALPARGFLEVRRLDARERKGVEKYLDRRHRGVPGEELVALLNEPREALRTSFAHLCS